jgi:hypothetical protein
MMRCETFYGGSSAAEWVCSMAHEFAAGCEAAGWRQQHEDLDFQDATASLVDPFGQVGFGEVRVRWRTLKNA